MRYKILVIVFVFFPKSFFGQNYDFVKVLSGQGIVYNNDSILLNKTKIAELHKILKIKDNSKNEISVWMSGEDLVTGEKAEKVGYKRIVEFKSFDFGFGSNTKRKLVLKSIRIKEDETVNIYTDTGLIMGMINLNIMDLVEKCNINFVSDDGLKYVLFNYGIILKLEKINDEDLKIVEMIVSEEMK